MANEVTRTTCCVVGGGPAGMMLGLLLARAGVAVTVLEKHKDFNRDFRGDTVHPSTLDLMWELGLLDEFLQLPHQEVAKAGGSYGDFEFTLADFRHLPTQRKFIALMPQWDFLEFLSKHAKRYPTFDLRLEHQAIGLIEEGARITGVRVRTPEGDTEMRADLVVGCDGRHSLTRQAARLPVREMGVPIDVLWFRVSRQPDDPELPLGNFNYGQGLVLINRGDYFQAGLLIRKDSFEARKREGLPKFRETLREVVPFLGERVEEVRDWDQVKLLSVQINRLRKWYRPGFVCIGDAAHAMSPVGGVGINLAIQDAVAAANLLAHPLRDKRVTERRLRRVQKRREFPTRVTQRFQRVAHAMLERAFRTNKEMKPPRLMKVIFRLPGRTRLMGRVIGLGARPEHIKSASAF